MFGGTVSLPGFHDNETRTEQKNAPSQGKEINGPSEESPPNFILDSSMGEKMRNSR